MQAQTNIKAIRALVAIAKYGSYTAAAEALNCSKGFLSEQIKSLEQQYNIQLVLRTTRQVSLTPAAQAFVSRCGDAFDQIHEAENELLQEQKQLTGQLRIATTGGVLGEDYIAPIIYAFMAEHPGIRVDLDFSSGNVDLLSADYDLAIRFGDLKDSSLIARPLLPYQSLLVASPDYLKNQGKPRHPRELAQHRLIVGTRTQWNFKKNRTETLTPTPYLKCGNGRVMLNAALQGRGITSLPSFYVENELKANRLISVLPDWTKTVHHCHIIYPPGRYRLTRVRKVVDYILADERFNLS